MYCDSFVEVQFAPREGRMPESHKSVRLSVRHRVTWIAAVLLGTCGGSISPARAQALAPDRDYEPVVVEASALANWVGNVDMLNINAYIFNGSAFEAIPLQIDKRRRIHINFNVNDPNDLAYFTHVCEYGYFPELGPPPPPPAPPADPADFSETLHASDELVFMLRDADAGTTEVSTNTWHPNVNVARDRYVLILTDTRTAARRFVYLYRWTGVPEDLNATDYVSWSPETTNACAPPTPPPQSVGTAIGTVAGRLSGLPSVSVHFGGNWVTDALQVNEGGTFLSDLVDRLRYSTFNEDENGWSCTGAPRILGVKNGQIRVIRGVQGAESGRHTTKYEFVYPTQLVSRVNLRVHDLASLNARVNHEQQLAEQQDAYLWTQTRKGASNSYLDIIDGSCGMQCFPDNYRYSDWTEVASRNRGSYVHLFSDPRPIPLKPGAANPVYIYSDLRRQGTTPSDYGEFGRQWADTACTQDGDPINDGGCGPSGPEGSDLLFARLEQKFVPQTSLAFPDLPGGITAQEFQENVAKPVTFRAEPENYGEIPVPPPQPCVPVLSAANTGAGAVDLSLSNPGGCGAPAGRRLFRATGAGPLVYLRDVRGTTLFRDTAVSAGQNYRYAAAAYNARNYESPLSQESAITVSDTVAPPAPWFGGTAGNGSATLSAGGVCTHDTLGFNVYISLTSGGPYTKLNSSPIRVTHTPTWVQTSLTNGTPYYFVATTTDYTGNESGYSAEIAIVPTP